MKRALGRPASMWRAAVLAWVACTAGGAAHAHEPDIPTLREVVVQSTVDDLQGVATSASEGGVNGRQLGARPLLRAGDVMETVPGLVATQHSGEGKANQYFLRGFNLDHGTDFATYVDGVPVNLPTHAHGQGYTDLYFVIPELIDSITWRKGPYWTEDGDFSAVGSARIRTVTHLPRPLARVEAGSFGWRRALAATSLATGGGDLLLAGESTRDDGPWTVPQALRKTNLQARYARGTRTGGVALGLTQYEASWTATDQVPQRAIDAGLIGRRGSLDAGAGGRTSRTGIDASWSASGNGTVTRASAYALRYRFDLFSDFTYAARGCTADPLPPACNARTDLDQFEQSDRRSIAGATLSQQREWRLLGRDGQLSYGVDLRRDAIGNVGLYDTAQRIRVRAVREDRVRVAAFGMWAQAQLQLAPQWHAAAGLRWDRRDIDVRSSVASNSGGNEGTLASPKVSLAWTPTQSTDVYANWGRGFHSSDARGTVMRVDPRDPATAVSPSAPLVAATGWETGTRQRWSDALTTTLAWWELRLDSELLFAGDAGTTEPSRPSVRRGIEWTANWRAARGWDVDANVSLSHARFRGNDRAGDRIPGALEQVATLGLSRLSGAWTLGARMRWLGSHPLTEDNTIRAAPTLLVNARIAYRMSAASELSLDVFNVFDRRLNDIQYAYASRLPGEAPFAEGVTPPTLHVHPGGPRSARVAWRVAF